ncbi:NitT/TauT family transport system permease protein [Nitrospirillum amazonense]|uniref:NitT/TauT family transport system permease protein n=1 Tax=Nitrospirillum amazonense TaxID=28077 RepID=A0A560EU47_9PROT|nr:NitT/TauT family transport system permease protein [Nitrospirillum amazonense]
MTPPTSPDQPGAALPAPGKRIPPSAFLAKPSRRHRGLWALLGVVAFLAVWEAVPRLGLVRPVLLPPPSAIPQAFAAEVRSGAWTDAILQSLGHYLWGLVIGSVGGIAAGVLTGMSRRLEDFTSWVVRLLRPIPGLAWVPFAIIWFGVTPTAAIFIIVLGVFWINYFAALGAVQAVDRDLLELADAFGHRSTPAKLVKIVLPAASGAILAGLRTGLGQAWMSVVAAELFGVPGLGQRMMQASSLLATDIVIVYMATMALFYGLVDMGFVAVRDRLMRWKA